jgi:hypothetical protein
MIPFILAAVGGYLIGDSVKSDATKMADGGMTLTAEESWGEQLANNPNWTNEELLKEYNSYKFSLSEFNAGRLKPSKVIGGGYKSSAIARRLAKQWLENIIKEYKTALEIRGVMADGGGVKNLDLKNVYNELRSKVHGLSINEETKDNISCSVRDWGNWEHDYEDYERDEEDFEDDDSMILSSQSAINLHKIVKEVMDKYPNAMIDWNTSEKNYIDFNISKKI